MSRKTSNHDRAVSAVQMVYGFPGKLLNKWEAEPLGNDEFMLHRHNGSSRKVKLNEHIETVFGKCIVSRSEFGTLAIGDYSVIIGKGIKHGFQARKMARKDTWTLVSDTGRTIGQVRLGDEPGQDPVSIKAGHLLQVGDEIYPIVPKKHDINLLVFRTPHENGYYSRINVLENGNIANRRDGAKGIFVPPAFDGDPALFYDNENHQKVLTAKFWIAKGGKSVQFHSRDVETAIKELTLERKLSEKAAEAIDAGIDPEGYDQYCAVLKELEPIREAWQKNSMMIACGAEYFRPHKIGLSNSSGYEMGR